MHRHGRQMCRSGLPRSIIMVRQDSDL